MILIYLGLVFPISKWKSGIMIPSKIPPPKGIGFKQEPRSSGVFTDNLYSLKEVGIKTVEMFIIMLYLIFNFNQNFR